MITKQKTSFAVFLIIALLVILPCVSAFGASIPYNTRDRPLYLAPGGEKEFSVSLSASPGKMTTTKVEVRQGSEIAGFIEGNQEYDIAAGGEVGVMMRVEVPQDAVEGSEYTVSFLLTDVTVSSQQGTVGVGGTSEIFYKVIVRASAATIEEPVKSNSMMWWILIIIILLAIVIVIYFYSQKKSNAKRK